MSLANTLIEVFDYIKKPTIKNSSTETKYTFKKFLHILFLLFTIRTLSSMINWLFFYFNITNSFALNIYDQITTLQKDMQKIDPIIFNESNSKTIIIILVSLISCFFAPTFKELIFRAPLVLIKKNNLFKACFYFSALLFAYFHVNTFGEITKETILLSPLLLLGMFTYGLVLGYIRIKFNFKACLLSAITFETLYFVFYMILWGFF